MGGGGFMSVTVGRSRRDFQKWGAKIVRPHVEKTGQQLHQKVHVQLDSEMVFATPVGNVSLWLHPESAPPGYTGGRARGGWQSSIHAPILTEPGTIDPNGTNTHQAAQNVAAKIPFAVKSFVANAVPYILRLDQGWSTQAPVDFIGRGFDRVGAQFR